MHDIWIPWHEASFCFIETGTMSRKDGRLYRLPCKRLQSEMVLKSGMNYQGKPMHFVSRDTWGLERPEQELYQPHFRVSFQKCASRIICNGCSDCGQCERNKTFYPL